jgi:hypothetical protein
VPAYRWISSGEQRRLPCRASFAHTLRQGVREHRRSGAYEDIILVAKQCNSPQRRTTHRDGANSAPRGQSGTITPIARRTAFSISCMRPADSGPPRAVGTSPP